MNKRLLRLSEPVGYALLLLRAGLLLLLHLFFQRLDVFLRPERHPRHFSRARARQDQLHCAIVWIEKYRISAPSVGTGYSVHCDVFTSNFSTSSPFMMFVQTL